MGLKAGLETCGKSRPHRDSIPGLSSPWQVAIPATLSRFQVSVVIRELANKQTKEETRRMAILRYIVIK